MYRIRLYIVPEQDEHDEKEDFSSSFVDKDLLSSNNGYWWDTVKGDGRVTVTHRANKGKVKVAFSESQQDKDHERGHCKEQRNNRVNKKNKVSQRIFGCFGYLEGVHEMAVTLNKMGACVELS